MKKYTIPTLTCAGLLLVTTLIRFLLEWPAFVPLFPYLLWIHVVIIALGWYGIVIQRKASGAAFGSIRFFLKSLPIWLALLAIPVTISSTPLFSMTSNPPGITPEGNTIHSRSWSEQEGKYFVVFNQTEKIEITEKEYLASNQELFIAFSSGWILFSYFLLVLWRYIYRREELAKSSFSVDR